MTLMQTFEYPFHRSYIPLMDQHHINRSNMTALDALNLYSQLSMDQMLRLYKLYKLDFELFGYSPAPYLKMAKRRAR